MKKYYIKMNNNDEHLSLGNLFRIVKDSSKNKFAALQSEIFCILFDLETINDTTVNNYCVGCRSIGSEYKQIYLNKEKKYKKDKNEFCDNIIGLLNIIDGVIHEPSNKINFINESESANSLARKLYNLAKNDKFVINEFTNKLYHMIDEGNIYGCLVEELIYIVINKKQPISEDELKKEVFENVLNDTSISSVDLQKYLSLKLREGINFDYSMMKLALAGNAYANFEIGSNEYYGFVKGYPRYDIAYKYLSKAAELNHASANFMIGNMYVRGLLGSMSNDELKIGYDYLVKSYELGNVAACNLIGNMYLNGIYPLNKDKDKAIEYFKKASINEFPFAYNNLGRISELDKDYKKAFEYYLKSANLGESWACNKVGEYYRLGTIKKDMNKAFMYYNKALLSNSRTLCYYAYYNLARYFYKNGYMDIACKNQDKYIEYLNIAIEHNIIEAMLELLYFNVLSYISSKDNKYYQEVIRLKELIEHHNKYNDEIANMVSENINKIVKYKSIDIKILDSIK